MTAAGAWTSLALALALMLVQSPPAADILQRDRNLGKAYYERGEYELAIEAFERVMAREDAVGRDYFNAGMAYLQNQEDDRALASFTTARAMEPALLEVDFGLGLLHKRSQRYPLAREAFERVVARDPEDPCTWFNLGAVSSSMGSREEASAAFRRVLDMGHARGQNFYVSALFRYANLLSRGGSLDEARSYFAEFEELREGTPNVALTPTGLENGRYGRVELPPSPSPERAPGASSEDRDREGRVTFAAAFELPATECDTYVRPALADLDHDGAIDVFLPSPCGADKLYRNARGGSFDDVTVDVGLARSEQSLGALFVDLDNSGTNALFVWSARGTNLYRNEEGRFDDATRAAGLTGLAPPATAVALDADNDGQLDIFLGGPASRLSLLRNDGDGTLTETPLSVPPEIAPANVSDLAAADFDQDGFTDVLVAREGGAPLLLLRNEGGSFRTTSLPFTGPDGTPKIDLLDIDRDSWIDAAVSSHAASPRFFRNRIGRLERLAGAPDLTGPFVRIDIDGDGITELMFSGGRALAYRTEGRFEELTLANTASGQRALGAIPASAVAADLEGAGDVTLLLPGNDGKTRGYVRPRPPASHFLRLELAGTRTNRKAVGALVELKAGRFYRKEIYPGHPVTFFMGPRDRLDVLRIGWTNGVIQNEIEVPVEPESGGGLFIEEEDRQTSSCPFLYVWDGARFRFLTDIVGRAPLGEVLPDGSLLTPHPDDYVRIPPGAMAVRDGEVVFQITEELRELAYLDAVELLAVDRPPGLEVFVDEKFSAPPFEPFRLYAVEKRREPVLAIDGGGKNVLSRIADDDGVYASELERHRVPGFAREHVLELTAPPELELDRLWLFLSGWVYWPSSSSMKALSANDSFAPRPPLLQVADGKGGWLSITENLGLPSGMGRRLVADLSNRLDGQERRLRIVTNFEVYWDEAFFAVPARESDLPTHRIAASSADLHYRGFSRVARARRSEPEHYDYEHLLDVAPWNAAPGAYTPYGERRDRLSAVDGRLVVMAPGDELTLRFDEGALPRPSPGMVREWFLHVTGWAKDQDPNTRHSRTVGPLPTQGSSSDDARSERYVPALVPPLAPPAALAERHERKEGR